MFDAQKSFPYFLGNALIEFEKVLRKENPDKILILGDTNSGLLSILANRYKIPVYHMEAGNRCYDDRVPEEANRRVIDSLSTYNLPYTENSRQNLLAEGYHKNYVLKTGNPILEVMLHYGEYINNSTVLDKLNLVEKMYVLVTAHRSENVDDLDNLRNIVNALCIISDKYRVVFSVHPRTRDKINKQGLTFDEKRVIVSEPFGFFDFVKLQSEALLTISDSGTVQEESCLLGVPAITIRESTERHETIECGSNVLTGTSLDKIVDTFNTILTRDTNWTPPDDYLINNVSDIVINILLGK
jgi:UDP-N-acetylglucosamine 2-epimerase (non-hydrolysing)